MPCPTGCEHEHEVEGVAPDSPLHRSIGCAENRCHPGEVIKGTVNEEGFARRAVIARKVRESFENGVHHTGTWGRPFYTGPGQTEGNAAATQLIMATLERAGVFDAE